MSTRSCKGRTRGICVSVCLCQQDVKREVLKVQQEGVGRSKGGEESIRLTLLLNVEPCFCRAGVPPTSRA